MFFANPVTAFVNFHGALKPGGRLVFVCWRAPELNPWLTVPFDSARHFAPDFEPPKSDVPFSAFAFASWENVEAIFADSGFEDIRLDSHEITLRMGDGDLDDCVDLVFKLGPVSGLLAAADDSDAPAVIEAVRTAVAPYFTGNCIEMAASVWIASARRP
jgi:SAM-dependent methyltransferase